MYTAIYAGAISDFFDSFFDKLEQWSSERWFLLVIFAIALLDSVIPIVPSETCVIIGGVAAAGVDASYPLWAVIVAGAFGAFIGDNLAYSIGHLFSAPLERRAVRKEKFRKKLTWAYDQLQARGGPLLITARFIPGGRSILTLSSGITRQPRLWFAKWIAIAAVIWATYAAGLAYVIGDAFKENHTAAFIIAFSAALSLTIIVEIFRHFRTRRRNRTMAREAPSA